jgi:hypothetical protein
MEINCTLFIQCFNFGIAYVILTRLIFKPILACIGEERLKREALQNALTASQEAIKELEAKRASSWQSAQIHFGDSLANIAYQHHSRPFSYDYEYESATDAQVDAHARRIHDAIMKKVSDDFK